jgi:hypothetical protein
MSVCARMAYFFFFFVFFLLRGRDTCKHYVMGIRGVYYGENPRIFERRLLFVFGSWLLLSTG